ncbi:hypothetical protein ABID19_000677 [Mesorhizobium robiniae]|uniref:Uncharacterized protein n=1 Tax=Mesorhizobium robiniae TaxID=559315 RepID=A0ABV2GH99_9HYPH
MATIPLQLAQRRLDTGSVVSYPGGSPLGAAMQGFGDELTAVAERYRQRKEQQEAFDAEILRRQFDGQIAQAENDATQNAPADGAGLHDTMYGQVDPRTGQVVKPGLYDTLFDGILPKVPESQRANFSKQKEILRAAGSARMATRQQARRDEYEQAEWSKVDNFYTGSIAQSDPNDTAAFEAIRQSGHDLIAKIGNPAARQAAEAAWRSNTAKALVQAMIAQDPKRTAEMLSAGPVGGRTKDDTVESVGGPPASGSGVLASRDALSGGLPPDERPVRGNSVEPDGKTVWAAGPWIADLSPDAVQDLGQKAQAATAANLVDARINISLAYQNAPEALMYTGNYSGETPGPEAFTAVYGVEDGGRQFQDFNRTFDVGRQAFGMRIKPNAAIEAEVLDARPKPNSATPEQDQARYEIISSAALQVLYARWTDAGDFVRKVFPNVDAAWNKVTRPDSESWNRRGEPDSYDPGAYSNAMAASVAAQKQLGIENIRPLPLAVVQNIVEASNDKDVPRADKDAILRDLSAGAPNPTVRAALSQQLADAGLPQLAQSAPITPAAEPTAAQETGASLPTEPSGKDQSVLGQAAADFGDYVTGGFDALGRIPHDIGIFLEDLRRDPLDAVVALSNSVPNPASGAPAASVAALKSLSQALTKGLITIRTSGVGKLAKPLEEFAAKRSDAASELVAEGQSIARAVDTKYLAAKQAALRLRAGPKPDKAELAEIVDSIARDPSGVTYAGATFGKAASKNYRKTFLDAHPNLEGAVVVHHAAERQVLKRYPGLVTEEEMHSLQNLRGIPKELDDLLHKVVFRFEWDEFYRLNPSTNRQQMIDYASYIDKKYGYLFNPPVGE